MTISVGLSDWNTNLGESFSLKPTITIQTVGEVITRYEWIITFGTVTYTDNAPIDHPTIELGVQELANNNTRYNAIAASSSNDKLLLNTNTYLSYTGSVEASEITLNGYTSIPELATVDIEYSGYSFPVMIVASCIFNITLKITSNLSTYYSNSNTSSTLYVGPPLQDDNSSSFGILGDILDGAKAINSLVWSGFAKTVEPIANLLGFNDETVVQTNVTNSKLIEEPKSDLPRRLVTSIINNTSITDTVLLHTANNPTVSLKKMIKKCLEYQDYICKPTFNINNNADTTIKLILIDLIYQRELVKYNEDPLSETAVPVKKALKEINIISNTFTKECLAPEVQVTNLFSRQGLITLLSGNRVFLDIENSTSEYVSHTISTNAVSVVVRKTKKDKTRTILYFYNSIYSYSGSTIIGITYYYNSTLETYSSTKQWKLNNVVNWLDLVKDSSNTTYGLSVYFDIEDDPLYSGTYTFNHVSGVYDSGDLTTSNYFSSFGSEYTKQLTFGYLLSITVENYHHIKYSFITNQKKSLDSELEGITSKVYYETLSEEEYPQLKRTLVQFNSNSTPYLPIRYTNTDSGTITTNPGLPDYYEKKKLLKYLDLDLQTDIINKIINKEGGNLNNVTEIFIGFNAPIYTEVKGTLKYLYNLFNYLGTKQGADNGVLKETFEADHSYSQSFSILGDKDTANGKYHHVVNYHYIDIFEEDGNGKKGEYGKTITISPDTTECEFEDNSECIKQRTITNSYVDFYKQISSSRRRVIRVYGLNVSHLVTALNGITKGTVNKLIAEDDLTEGYKASRSNMSIPVIQEVMLELDIISREELLMDSFSLVAYAATVTDLTWYQTEDFLSFTFTVIEALGMAFAILTFGAGEPIDLLLMLLAQKLLEYALKEILTHNLSKSERYLVMVLYAAASVATGKGIGSNNSFTLFFDAILGAIQIDQQLQAKRLQEEYEAFNEEVTEFNKKEVEEAKVTNQSVFDKSGLYLTKVEKPEDFFNRVGADVIQLTLDQVNRYHEAVLKAPKNVYT